SARSPRRFRVAGASSCSLPTDHSTMKRFTEHDPETMPPNLLFRLVRVLRLMRRAGVGPGDALDLLADQLRTFADYEERREEAEHLPYPLWLYGQDPA